MNPLTRPNSEVLLYQTENGHPRIDVKVNGETDRLTQKLMVELFQKDIRTINEHIGNIFEAGELTPDSGIRNFRITAADGKTYNTRHYNLENLSIKQKWTIPVVTRNRPPTGNSQSICNFKQYA